MLVGIGILLDADFSFIFFAYVIAQALTFMVLFIETHRIQLLKFERSIDLTLAKKAHYFLYPSPFNRNPSYVMNWTDTLMLGYYKSSEVVGIYNAASPLARLLPIFLNSAGFIYMPIASSLYAQGKLREMGRVYQILTKWVFLLTLPIFSIMFLFPEATISSFYFVANVFRSLKLYQRTKIHPFSWNYVKPLIISFLLLGAVQQMKLRVSNIWEVIGILTAFLTLYFGLVLLSKSIDREDVELLLAIERKLRINLELLKRILKRFI